MPNEVFLRTRAGLCTMVSSRAAGRILEGALKGSGHNPDDVNQSQMRSALLGPVLEELELVLPRHGLKRNLERLAKSLREPDGEKEAARALLTGSIPANVVPIEGIAAVEALDDGAEAVGPDAGKAEADEPRTDPATPLAETDGPRIGSATPPAEALEPRTAWPAPPQRAEANEARPEPADRFTPAAPEGPFEAYAGPQRQLTEAAPVATVQSKRVTPRLLRRLGDDELDEIVTRFALIENVRLVALVRADGPIPVFRGEGLDLELLSRLSRLTLSLLAKGGDLRSLHLGHSLGQLFLFPIGPDLLIVYGGSDLNLGSVTTAFTALALEEEL